MIQMKKFAAFERIGVGVGVKELAMPNRRKDREGSFGGHLDELVQKFQQNPPKSQANTGEQDPKIQHINDRLFESAWRKDRPKA